jgi:hypothetical protein
LVVAAIGKSRRHSSRSVASLGNRSQRCCLLFCHVCFNRAF